MNRNKNILLILTIICFPIFISYLNSTYFKIREEILINFKSQPEKSPKSAEFWNLTGSPIYIDDNNPNYNWSKTAFENSWCRGNGSLSNPYIIENVTINGQSSGSCIEIRNSNVPFIIRNCTLSNAGNILDVDAAINLRQVENGKLIGNNVSSNPCGILLYYGHNNNISRNILHNNSKSGLKLILSYYNIIELNNFSYNYDGISLVDSFHNIISSNLVRENLNYGIYMSVSRYSTLLNNKIHNNTNSGIYIQWTRTVLISNNVIKYNEYSGIQITDESYDITISENEVCYNEYSGIQITDESYDITISENEVCYNEYSGIQITDASYDIIISENEVGHNIEGILMKESFDIEISSNNIKYNKAKGLYIMDLYNCDVSNNNISSNEDNGIYLENTNYTLIIENQVMYNSVGLYFINSNNNEILRNNVNFNSIAKQELNCKGNYFKDNEGIEDTKKPNNELPFETILMVLIIILLLLLSSAGIVFAKKKYFSKEIRQVAKLQKTEAEVDIDKEKHFCVVHRGKIVGAAYICPKCESYYCLKCATSLKENNEACWACNSKIDIDI